MDAMHVQGQRVYMLTRNRRVTYPPVVLACTPNTTQQCDLKKIFIRLPFCTYLEPLDPVAFTYNQPCPNDSFDTHWMSMCSISDH